jgi:hypothetical protein
MCWERERGRERHKEWWNLQHEHSSKKCKFRHVSIQFVLYHIIISYHIYSPYGDLYRYAMRHTVYISMQVICHNTVILNTTVQFDIDTCTQTEGHTTQTYVLEQSYHKLHLPPLHTNIVTSRNIQSPQQGKDSPRFETHNHEAIKSHLVKAPIHTTFQLTVTSNSLEYIKQNIVLFVYKY